MKTPCLFVFLFRGNKTVLSPWKLCYSGEQSFHGNFSVNNVLIGLIIPYKLRGNDEFLCFHSYADEVSVICQARTALNNGFTLGQTR